MHSTAPHLTVGVPEVDALLVSHSCSGLGSLNLHGALRFLFALLPRESLRSDVGRPRADLLGNAAAGKPFTAVHHTFSTVQYSHSVHRTVQCWTVQYSNPHHNVQ